MMEPATQLFDAIKIGDLAALQALLDKFPELNAAADTSGLSAVLTALYYQQPLAADLLIESGAPLNLFEAAASGRISRVQELLQINPRQVNDWAPDGFQPLGLACFFGQTEVVRLLLASGAEVNSASHNGLQVQPLHSAVAGQHIEIARMLLEHGADPNARQGEDFTPLHGAAQNGQEEMIRLLLIHGANPRLTTTSGRSARSYAEESPYPQTADLL